jgi:hypothetical protein
MNNEFRLIPKGHFENGAYNNVAPDKLIGWSVKIGFEIIGTEKIKLRCGKTIKAPEKEFCFVLIIAYDSGSKLFTASLDQSPIFDIGIPDKAIIQFTQDEIVEIYGVNTNETKN